MKSILILTALLATSFLVFGEDSTKRRLYELRTYHANEGKLEVLHARFRDHTCALFEKHGVQNVAYWVPVENQGSTLIYLLSYPDREARETSWKSFASDPAWKAAYEASTKDGKLVGKVEHRFLSPTGYSPELQIEAAGAPRLFEMRTYTTEEGRLDALHARFRDHTCALFTKHGMTNLLYTVPTEGEAGAGTTLIYFLAHKDEAARNKSFDAFREDPAWQAARQASEEAGPILVKEGVQSVFLKATDYSPMK
jgi:hypothetical protein